MIFINFHAELYCALGVATSVEVARYIRFADEIYSANTIYLRHDIFRFAKCFFKNLLTSGFWCDIIQLVQLTQFTQKRGDISAGKFHGQAGDIS